MRAFDELKSLMQRMVYALGVAEFWKLILVTLIPGPSPGGRREHTSLE
jgi:hypothetical protein